MKGRTTALFLLLLLMLTAPTYLCESDSSTSESDSSSSLDSDMNEDAETDTDTSSDKEGVDNDWNEEEDVIEECATHEHNLLLAEHENDSETSSRGTCDQCAASSKCRCNYRNVRNKYTKKCTGYLQLLFMVDIDHLNAVGWDAQSRAAQKLLDPTFELMRKAFKDVVRLRFLTIPISSSRKFGVTQTVVHGYNAGTSGFVKTAGVFSANFMEDAMEYYDHYPIYVVDLEKGSKYKGTHGFAAFPWHSPHIFLEIEAEPAQLARNAVHELGHALGLYHTFHGVECDKALKNKCSKCHEKATCTFKWYKPWNPYQCSSSSPYTGDLCEDTIAGPAGQYDCGETINEKDKCSGKKWGKVPTYSWMSYGCHKNSKKFTACQIKRMRCFIRNSLKTYYTYKASRW